MREPSPTRSKIEFAVMVPLYALCFGQMLWAGLWMVWESVEAVWALLT